MAGNLDLSTGQRRPLTELLVGRASKRKNEGIHNTQNLQESALCLLSSHQDLGDLLAEMESPPSKKLSSPVTSLNSLRPKTKTAFSGSLIGSALQGQASQLGLPVGILSARIAAAQIDEICRTPLECTPSALLNPEQREKLLSLLQMVKNLSSQNSFCRSVFCQELWRVETPLALEVVWHLHKENIELEELLDSCLDPGAAVEWLCSGLTLLCRHLADPAQEPELPGLILTDVAITLIHHGFQWPLDQGKKPERHKVFQVSRNVLNKMLSWFLDAITEGKRGEMESQQMAEPWLHAFEESAYRSSVPQQCREQFFIDTMTQVLTYKPLLKVSDAIRMQGEWSFAKACPLLTGLYRRLFVMFSVEKLILHLQQVLETHEVNWQHVLTCVSTLVVCQSEAQLLVRDLLTSLLTKAFESYELESIITAFLIARQAALEGPAAFLSYTEWFKVSFGSTSGYHSGSKKSLVFLFKFLSDLVPFEAPQYLKVHLIYPPFVATKYRPLLLEYISLAKTRMADLKVSIEDMGLYEDLSSVNDPAQQPQFQALQDVEKAIHIFENTGKIPASVMEASIFRRPYYNSRFLPALLAPRLLPSVPDLRMRFIDSLKRSDKIPTNVYSGYLQACRREKQKQLQGEPMQTERSEEPMEHLKAALEELGPLITDLSKYEAVPAQIAMIADRLGVLFCSSNGDVGSMVLPFKYDFTQKMDQQDHMAADLLLKSFCKNVVMAASRNPPDRQGPWPCLFVKMLCGLKPVLTAVLTRIVQLVSHQGALLNDAHILGLAVFVVHLNESKALLQPVSTVIPDSQTSSSEDADPMVKFWDHLLECRTGESMSVCLRFCTAAVSYTLCRFPSFSQDEICSYIPPVLIKKIRHALPRQCLEARGIACGGEEQEVEASWISITDHSVNWKRAALCLWRQRLFSELLKLEIFQLSFREWLLSEMQLESHKDVLSDGERQDYHRWAVYHCYLPSPSSEGGCDGDLEEACSVVINAVVDFCNRCELSSDSTLDGLHSPLRSRTCTADVLCRLQEMICDLELTSKLASASQGCTKPRDHCGHFLFKLFKDRPKPSGDGSTTGGRLTRHQELLSFSRVLVALPPSVLLVIRQERKQTVLDGDDFFHFVDTELKNICSRGWTLPYDITEHFFRGLLSASVGCEEPAESVDSLLIVCRDKCPVLLTSAALWWPRLEPVIHCQWKRYFSIPLAQELLRLKECQNSIISALSASNVLPHSDPAWIYAAFIFVNLRLRTSKASPGDLKLLGLNACELLLPMLFYSIMDLISARLVSKEGAAFRHCLDMCLEILGCLEERGESWLLLFHRAQKELGSYHTLHRTASEHHISMLPIAFYSLVPYLQQDLLTKDKTFLDVAVRMYAQLVGLFVDGDEPGIAQIDSLELISQSRLYLLCSLPLCPKKSQLQINQLLEDCGDFDPEVKAALLNTLLQSVDHTLYDEPILF